MNWKVSSQETDKIELCTHVKKQKKKTQVENDNVILDPVPTK